MTTETQTADTEARLVLPKSFANATVIIEQISDTELRIRRAVMPPEEAHTFREETTTPLTDRDRDHFLELLATPPAATDALKKAAARYKASHG